VAFSIDVGTGMLTYVEHEPTQGRTPRNFGIDPTGTYLLAANQDSDTIVVLRIDRTTGRLTPTGNSVRTPTPVCVKMIRLPITK
jgi:6-phosphogluconolactonase